MYFCLSVWGGTGGVLPVPSYLLSYLLRIPLLLLSDWEGPGPLLSRFHTYIHTYTKNRAAAEAERELGKAGETGGLDTRAAQLTNPYSQTET